MIYFGNASGGATRDAMTTGELGMMATPAEGKSPAFAKVWAADNGCFGKGYPGDAGYLAWLGKHSEHAPRCMFATAPDVVGDAAATLERSAPFYAPIRALGYPVALVAQDGLTPGRVPWADIDALFIGGSTDWKLGAAARLLITEAKARGLFVHIGRVNSHRRMRYAQFVGADSVDGTFLTFGPEKNLPKLRGWLRDIHNQATLLAVAA
jgi:hypothetical protein